MFLLNDINRVHLQNDEINHTSNMESPNTSCQWERKKESILILSENNDQMKKILYCISDKFVTPEPWGNILKYLTLNLTFNRTFTFFFSFWNLEITLALENMLQRYKWWKATK